MRDIANRPQPSAIMEILSVLLDEGDPGDSMKFHGSSKNVIRDFEIIAKEGRMMEPGHCGQMVV